MEMIKHSHGDYEDCCLSVFPCPSTSSGVCEIGEWVR